MRLRISGARVVDPANGVDTVTDVCIADGRVQSVGKAAGSFEAERSVDASGLVLIPGY
jgi:dihydroorotase